MKQDSITSVEQSKRLMALGVKMWNADYWYIANHVCGFDDYELSMNCTEDSSDVPAWELSTILNNLPQSVTTDDNFYRLVMGPYKGSWIIEYNTIDVTEKLVMTKASTLIEAALQMLEWLMNPAHRHMDSTDFK